MPLMWELECDRRFDPMKHLVLNEHGSLVHPITLSEEGRKLALVVFNERVDKRKMYWGRNLDRYILAISPTGDRHAMERTSPVPSLFALPIAALCGVEFEREDWVLSGYTTDDAVSQVGVLTCEYCQGILAVNALGEV